MNKFERFCKKPLWQVILFVIGTVVGILINNYIWPKIDQIINPMKTNITIVVKDNDNDAILMNVNVNPDGYSDTETNSKGMCEIKKVKTNTDKKELKITLSKKGYKTDTTTIYLYKRTDTIPIWLTKK